ncbi:MAG: transcriptional regulator, partial [Paenibacillus sp.]|nr:transcriptional regulator [Paenibacillus sp.]
MRAWIQNIKSNIVLRNWTLFRKNLTIILLVTTLPVFLISASFHKVGTEQIESLINETHDMLLTRMSEKIESELSQLEISVRHWSYNPLFGEYLASMDIYKDPSKANSVLDSLSTMERSNALIKKVEVYLHKNSVLFSKYDGLFSQIANVTKKNTYETMFQQKPDLYWYYGLDTESSPSTVSTTIIQKIPAESSKPIGALVIHFNNQALNNMMNQLNPYKNGSALLLNERGELIGVDRTGSHKGVETSAIETQVIGTISNNPERSGSFKQKWDGESYTVSYGLFERTGWKYVIITPISKLTAPLSMLSRLILYISLVTLIIVIIAAWITSIRLYKPINRLLKVLHKSKDGGGDLHQKNEIEWIELQWNQLTRESQLLQTKLEEKIVTLREGFLYRLFHGHFYYLSEAEMRNNMEQLGWDLNGRTFMVILFQLSDISNLEGRFSETDEQLITFAASNIITELMNTIDEYNADVINWHDLTVGLFVQIADGDEKRGSKQQLYPIIEKMMQTLTSLLKTNVTAVHSKKSGSLKELPNLFEDTRQAMRFRELQCINQIIDAEEIFPTGHETIDYPFVHEKEVLQAVRMCLHEEAIFHLDAFLQELQLRAGKEALLLQGALQLLGNIQNSILQSGYNPRKIYEGVNLFEELLQLREHKEMLRWFDAKVLMPYIKELTETHDIRMKQIVEKVILSLEEIYMNDISLEYCAELHDVNPFTLSKAFKKITGVNFINYLTDLRLAKSKELLVKTNVKISDIAEKVGYQV